MEPDVQGDEPAEEIYEEAYQAFKHAPLGSSIVRAIVNAVWPLAVAEGRRQCMETDYRNKEQT